MKEYSNKKNTIRDKIIGLGKDSIHKSYYPQLQNHIKELEIQKKAVENKNKELIETLVQLKKTKVKLQTSEERFRTLFDNTNDAIFIQNSTLNIVDCNATALKLFNVKKEEIVDKPPLLLIPNLINNSELVRSSTLKKMKLAISGISQAFELSITTKKSMKKQIFISLNRFELSGKIYLQTIVRDTTEIKKLQKELLSATIKTEEQERARFAKELHDGVGPILSTVKLYFQWLADTSDPEQRKIIIEKGNKNINEAIKALKEVSNNLSPHILNNYGFIEGLSQFIERITATGKIEINFRSTLKQRLKHDYELTLYRIVTELINNTLKHAQATIINIKIKHKSDLLAIDYKDNGIGMNENNDNKSLGLGLSNIQNRIQNIGGDIKIKTKPNEGFRVKISVNL